MMNNRTMAMVLRLLAFAAFLSVAFGKSSWAPCSKDSYQVKVKDVQVVPDPAVSGNDVAFVVSATTETQITSGKLAITVLFHGIHVHKEVDDLCEKTDCPVAVGDFVLKNSQNLPGVTPPGPYRVKLELLDAKSRVLTCTNVNFQIVRSGSDQSI